MLDKVMKQLKYVLICGLLIFLLDRLSKWYIVDYLNLRDIRFLEVYPPFLNLTMAWNTGINFGLFDGTGPWLLTAIALVISGIVLFWALRQTDYVFSAGAGFVIGGALGNAYDRLTEGAVMDFLNMSCCGFTNPFAFNIADIAIFIGMLLIIWRGSDEKPKEDIKTL